jgi:hypothetical protein
MATSKSFDSSQRWTAGALLFSGRPNPVWSIDLGTADRLETIWNSLRVSAASAVADQPPLGYRGCFLRQPDGTEWSAFAGVITRRSSTGAESRDDPDRKFERLVLATAPANVLPSDLAI